MRWLGGIICVLAACGRVGFDDATRFGDDASPGDGQPGGDGDGPPGDGAIDSIDAFVCVGGSAHDEDADGIRDSCDVCPHIADPGQPDMDGDRVGDMCDPEPLLARQQIILFDGFASIDAAWNNTGGTIVNDQLVLDARGGTSRQIARAFSPAHDLLIIGGTTGNADAGTHHVSFGWRPTSGGGNAYCEMYDTGAVTRTQFSWTFDDVNYMAAGTTAWAGTRLANGAGRFSFELTSANVACSSTWNGLTFGGGNVALPALAPERVFIYSENMLLRVSYFIDIRTN